MRIHEVEVEEEEEEEEGENRRASRNAAILESVGRSKWQNSRVMDSCSPLPPGDDDEQTLPVCSMSRSDEGLLMTADLC